MEHVLTRRDLGRATLARQLLLTRERLDPMTAVERVAGLQAQVREPPFIGLASRLDGFRREVLIAAIEDRRVVRATAMRCTMHLLSARDFLSLWGAIRPAVARAVRGWTGKRLAGLDMESVAAQARAHVHERPRTFSELRELVPEIAATAEPQAIAYAVRAHVPLVQVPDGGSTGHSNRAPYGLAEDVLGAPADEDPDPSELIRRYLAAFGPASVADAQTWSGLTGLKPAFAALREELVTFADEDGRELFDLPDAPRPPADADAPARLLPEYDNLILGHADRTRLVDERHRKAIYLPAGRVRATFLVGGRVAGVWSGKPHGEPDLEPFGRLSGADRRALEAEFERLRSD